MAQDLNTLRRSAKGGLLQYHAPEWEAYSTGGGATSDFLQLNSAGLWVPHTLAAADVGSGQALTKTDDTNVTVTLGGTPTTALLKAASLTLGWTGTLGVSRGGTGGSTLGEWTTVTHTGTDYVSSAGTLTVAAGDLISFQYTLIGKTMTVTFEIVTATLATTAAANIQILIPNSKTAKKRSVGWGVGMDNGTVAAPAVVVLPASDSTKIFVFRDATFTNTWAVQTDTLAVRGGITFEIN